MPRKFDPKKDWAKYKLRQAERRMYKCSLCPMKIVVGDLYFDAGNGVRVHESCGRFNSPELSYDHGERDG